MPVTSTSTGTDRPEPVLDEAKVAGRVSGVLTALLAVLAVIGVTSAGDTPTLVEAGVAVAGGIVTVVNYVVPRVRAMRARAKVTPLAAPQTADGTPLVPAR